MPTSSPADLLVERFAPSRPSLRVALVTETYPPEINGVATTLHRLVQGLQARGHDVQLIRPRQSVDTATTRGGSITGDVLMRGIPIPRYPHLRMGLPAKKQLLAQWTTQRPDLVHIATEGPLGWSALQAARKLKLPVSTDFRTNFHSYSNHYGISWLHKPISAYLRKFHNLAHCTLVPTQGLMQELAQSRFERLRVVARGIDTVRFTPERRDQALRSTWGASATDKVVLYVGRVAPEKNLPVLVQAFKALLARDATVRLVVVGDGPKVAELLAECHQVNWLGSRTGTELASCYASADLFLFPSVTETFGNVTLEALASGLAVVACQHAAAAEVIVNGHNGLLATPGDAHSFVAQAVAALDHATPADPMRLAARASMLSRDWQAIVEQMERIWSELLWMQGHQLGVQAEPVPLQT